MNWFCAYMACAITFDYIMCMTLFMAIIVAHERRDQARGVPAVAYERAAAETSPLPGTRTRYNRRYNRNNREQQLGIDGRQAGGPRERFNSRPPREASTQTPEDSTETLKKDSTETLKRVQRRPRRVG